LDTEDLKDKDANSEQRDTKLFASYWFFLSKINFEKNTCITYRWLIT